MKKIRESYRLLLYVQVNLDKEKLEKIYGVDLGSHLWDKFLYYNYNLLMFINYLDDDNQEKFFNSFETDNILFTENNVKNFKNTDDCIVNTDKIYNSTWF